MHTLTFVIDIVVKIVSHLLKKSIPADRRSTIQERNKLGHVFINKISQPFPGPL